MFNKLVVAALPLIPRPIIRKVSMRYIAGDHLADAMSTARQLLEEEGARATVDVLGEFVENREQALKDKSDSLSVLDAISRENMTETAGLSIKPTSLGLGIDTDFAYENIKELATRARDLGIFMRIDMENTPYTDDTLEVYRKLRDEGFDRVGLVFQTMLRRTEQDIRDLIEYKPSIRLCKGLSVRSSAAGLNHLALNQGSDLAP
jgi:proline dehydrogenase